MDDATPVIRSVFDCQDDLISAALKLHFPNGICADLTFGNGSFWKKNPLPKYCFDIDPTLEGVTFGDSTSIPLDCDAIFGACFDPPFLTYIKNARKGASIMGKRFSGYWAYSELENHYKETLKECRRVLRKKGRLLFKCQDIIHNHSMHPTHVNVINWAAENFLKLKDIFILSAKHRLPNAMSKRPNYTQKHARIFHSYFLIFEKRK